ncbi:MAG: acyl-CoA dehydrogenase, partial [Actinobacteria bacterium]|nr:acyl-CoA dehydrogenase [Actinomycetota bacterium]
GAQAWFVGEPPFCTSGPGPSMILLGDERLRTKYLPDLVEGRTGCAIALTEPNHGSDLTHLEATAELDGDEWVINGSKKFITGAVENELYAVFVRFDGIPGAKGIGAVVVEKGTPGFTMNRGPVWMGVRGLPHGDLEFSNVRIPAENLISGPGNFATLMSAFNIERLHNCAYSLGTASAAFDEAVEYTQRREAFGRPIIEFQATYHAIADMWTSIEAHRMLTYRAAANAVDGKFPDALEVSTAKLFGGTMLPQLTMKSLELHGGYGVTMDYSIQRLHRDAVTAIAAGGAPTLLRNTIASQLFPHLRFAQTRPR